MNLKNIVLSEGSQTQKNIYSIIPFIWNVQKKQIYESASEDGEFFGGDRNILELVRGDDCITLSMYKMTLNWTV
jgi:hypothetical protein